MDPKLTTDQKKEQAIVAGWGNPVHTRQRIQPHRSDVEYPVLSDLNNFIKRHGSLEKITILDFGAGASPYQIYFPNADYRRADILKTEGLDYHIGPDSRISEKDEQFDLVISTQVLEHVENVDAYLMESFRVLKKGGTLLLTTHGIWEEHGVPFDFQRWTEAGLKRDLERAKYANIIIFKLTCGLHAGLFFFIKTLFAAKAPVRQPARILFKIFRTFISKIFPVLYRCCDYFWPGEKITLATSEPNNNSFYAIIAATAKKNP